jgi:gliding motility-associated-like protein
VRKFLVIFLFLLCCQSGKAQLVVDPTYTAQQLTDLIVGDGIAVSNIVLNCPGGSSAYFDASATNINMTTGVLLTTGTVANATLGNTDAGISTCNGAPGDPQVEVVTNETTYDACILEFDIVPTCTQLDFTYVFASDEYPEYINREFADAMVITIAGPGIVGQQNIALVPNTATGVGITTVNGNVNSAYYVANGAGIIEYDGFTVLLTAAINVTQCQTYHVKIAVADAADCIFDSGLFIAENSLDCGVNNATTTDATVGLFQPIEGCRTYDIELCRQGDTSAPYDLNISYAGTAANGADYTLLPTLLNFPVGVQCQTITVEAINDGIVEGDETILFIYQAVSGVCTVFDTIEIHIIDDQNLTPDFYYNDVCFGSTVFFNNGTSITPPATVTDFVWKYGDGSQLAQYNSSHLYATEGDYDVWLIATSNDNCVDSVMQTVHVYGYPTADFTFVDACLGNPADFTNLSTPSSNDVFGDIVWNFGDGGSANSWDATHYYSIPDTFTVSLTVYTQELSCSHTLTDTIIVYPPINTSFIAANVCFGDTVSFFNQSSGNAIWEWNFGDGTPFSSTFNTSHSYAAAGVYDVRLVGISPNACNDTTFKQVTVYDAPQASFTTADICENELAQFTNTTVLPTYGALGSWYWSFSDSTNSSSYSPLHLFPSAGQYTATLVVYNEMLGCSDTAESTITLYQVPNAEFTVANVCDGITVVPNNLSLGTASAWTWNFGDGPNWVQQANPSNTYAQSGTYTISMVATYQDQCADTTTHTVTIYALPIAAYNWNYVCEGIATPFLNQSAVSFPENIVNWIWNYGDGTPADTVVNASHIYPNGGSYNTQLQVRTGHGCTDNISQSVWVNHRPDPVVTTSDPVGCPDLCVQFYNLSTIGFGDIISRRWNFGDFQFSNDTNVTHCYDNDDFYDPSYYNIRLDLKSDSGCTATQQMDSLVVVYPVPYANFDWTPDSISTFDPHVQFIDESKGPSLWEWDFGDTNVYSTSYLREPDFKYSEYGYHDIQLIVENDYGCIDTMVKTIYIYADLRFYIPNAFTPDNNGINEVFQGYGSDIGSYNMRIFTRWGSLVFESNDIDYAWDGTINGRAADAGMYIYEFNIRDLTDEIREYTGYFSLIR